MRTKKAKWMTAGALALALTVGAGAWLADGVANAATSKSSTSAQATASDATKDTSNWKWSGDRGGKGGHGGFGIAIADESVATALGLTADELKTELQAGKTLADIAKAQGVDAAKVTTAVQAVLKAKLDAALADGKLTQAQYDEQSAKLADAATSIVNGEKAAGMGFGGGRGGKGGPARGAASNSDSSASTSTSAT